MGTKHLMTQCPSVTKALLSLVLNAPLRHSPHEAAGPKKARTSSGREVKKRRPPEPRHWRICRTPTATDPGFVWTKTNTTEGKRSTTLHVQDQIRMGMCHLHWGEHNELQNFKSSQNLKTPQSSGKQRNTFYSLITCHTFTIIVFCNYWLYIIAFYSSFLQFIGWYQWWS